MWIVSFSLQVDVQWPHMSSWNIGGKNRRVKKPRVIPIQLLNLEGIWIKIKLQVKKEQEAQGGYLPLHQIRPNAPIDVVAKLLKYGIGASTI